MPPGAQPGANPYGRDLGTRVYNVRDFGAKGDGKSPDTAAVQAAIDACTKDQGGTVLVPAGVFVIGSIEIKSHVTLHVAASGKLLGSMDGSQYHASGTPTRGDTTLNDGNWALIYGVEATNVTIEGPGMIDGGGAVPSGLGGSRRPYLLLFYRCKNLTVRTIDLFNCPYHTVRMIQSAYAVLDGIHIHNRVSGNNDGFHFISAEYVNMVNCNVQSGDDACALFGSCKFITITNCSFSTRWSVFRFGGGVAENITVSNCLLTHVYGCPIKIYGDPGSHFKNLSFSNLVLDDVTGPISISMKSPAGMAAAVEPDLFSEPSQPAQPASRAGAVTARNISFSNIHGSVTTTPRQLPDFPRSTRYNDGERMSCIILNCVGSAVVENISFDNINLTFGGGGTAEAGANREVPEVSGEYYAMGPMPAYALYARNVKGLTLQNLRFQVASPELRPAVVFDRVRDATVSGMSVEGNARAESALRFTDTQDVLLSGVRLTTPAAVFLAVEGGENQNIKVQGGDFSKAGKPLAAARGAAVDVVKIS